MKTTPSSPSTLMTTQQVADRLGIPVQTLYAWRHEGTGPVSARIGRHLRYRADDVEAWIDAQFEAESR